MHGKILELSSVRYAPGGTTNLISQRLLERTGWKPSYSDTNDERLRRKLFDKDGYRLEFKKRDDGFYWMKASPEHSAPVMTGRSIETLEDNIVMKWHLKLAHLNEAVMKKMVKEDLVDGDVKYFQLVQDEASRFKWVFLIERKSDAEDNLLNLLLQLEKDFKIKMFSSDQGGEFKNKKLDDFFRKNGIRTLSTNAYTPEENCLVEKLNEVLHYVVHVGNMSVTKALENVTTYQKQWGRKSD
ncbi:Integrase, catalytic core protein [Phytophthora megakarya]|uniref:Integrase, catalytic core protein n=1 Tax=Phytophthora megakarya TaxID=4795 RepID=A0A225VAP2_9STRA|nr:Integrase, catalytic core protein [Phytophthora megakarya]